LLSTLVLLNQSFIYITGKILMKVNRKVLARFASMMAISLMATSASYAATIPSSIIAFDASHITDTFTFKSKGWSDPAFGDMGWTHSSAWGTVTATEGKVVSIAIDASAAAGIHPGVTVWFRGANDTAPDNYVVDHFYPQNANFAKFGATDETTGTALGNIIMQHVVHAYDQDGNSVIKKKLAGKTDGAAGKLIIRFKAPTTGTYMFVVGGFNPDAIVDNTLKYNATVTVRVQK
jgi:hypothetical protein